MSKQTRRKYTDEFKVEAVRLVLEQGLPVSQVAEDLGISRNLLSTWRKKISEDITGSNELSSAKEIKRLRRENAVLREERNILKKAARYFAKESK